MAEIELTTVARVKALLKHTGTGDDGVIAPLVSEASHAALAYMDRAGSSESYTEFLDVHSSGTDQVFSLKAYPVSSVTSVHYDQDWSFGATELLDPDDEYRLMRGGETGQIMIRVSLSPGPGVLKIVYTGGLAADTSAFVAAYPDIAGALDQQVAFWFQHRRELGSASVGGSGGSVAINNDDDFLPFVRTILQRHRRTY